MLFPRKGWRLSCIIQAPDTTDRMAENTYEIPDPVEVKKTPEVAEYAELQSTQEPSYANSVTESGYKEPVTQDSGVYDIIEGNC